MNLETTHDNSLLTQIRNAPILFADADQCTECEPELQGIQNQISLCNKRIEHLGKKYYEALISNLKKDLTIRQLKKKLSVDGFNEFRNLLPSPEIDRLIDFDGASGKDSKFVLQTMRIVYSKDLPRLKKKTYSGRRKEALSPDKKDTIKNLYMKRIDLHEKNEEIATVRKSKFSKYVKNAIELINKG